MKFSWAISWVRWFRFVETSVSKTISVLTLRVVELMWVMWTTRTFYLYLSKLRSQGHPFATGDLWVQSLPSLPGSAFWLASMLLTGYQAWPRLKPLSLLKFFLFSLMWMAIHLTRLIARENFIILTCQESIKSYKSEVLPY
jgi:hypothetical protein